MPQGLRDLGVSGAGDDHLREFVETEHGQAILLDGLPQRRPGTIRGAGFDIRRVVGLTTPAGILPERGLESFPARASLLPGSPHPVHDPACLESQDVDRARRGVEEDEIARGKRAARRGLEVQGPGGGAQDIRGAQIRPGELAVRRQRREELDGGDAVRPQATGGV